MDANVPAHKYFYYVLKITYNRIEIDYTLTNLIQVSKINRFVIYTRL